MWLFLELGPLGSNEGYRDSVRMGLCSDRFGVLIKGQDIECSLFSSPSPRLCTKDSSRVSKDPVRGRLSASEEESPRCDLSMPVIRPWPQDSRTAESECPLPETSCAAQAEPKTGAHNRHTCVDTTIDTVHTGMKTT